MSRYRTKPVEITARQYDGDWQSMQDWCRDMDPGQSRAFFFPVEEEDRTEDPDIVAEVWDELHSTWVGVKVGQWIIHGTRGEFYPCDPDVFAEKYEQVEDR